MKRPLGFVALFYVSGLMMAEFFAPSLLVLFSISIALAVTALTVRSIRPLLVWPLIFLTGWTNLVWRTAIVSPDDLRTLLTEPAEEVVARGRLPETPSGRIYLHDDQESSRTLAQLTLTAIRRGANWQSAYGTILVTTSGTVPGNYFAGQEVEIAGVIAPPQPPLAEGLFDYRTYLRRQGIYFQLKTFSTNDWQLISTNRIPPLSDRFLAWAKATMARGLPGEDQPLRLLWAMTLGSKDVLTSEAYDPFIESGTMHIFAISGLHIALIAGILVSLLRVLRVSRMWCGVVVIPLIWFYTAATGWQSSAIRSTVMMSVIIAGWSLKRPTDLLNSLAAAALIILLWDPQQLFQASFQLSFFVVLSIALFLPPLEKVCDQLLQLDPLLPLELIPRWQRWLGLPLRFLLRCLATSLAAWLGSWPLTAYYFHLFSPVTLLANLLIVPLSSAALACNLGSLICGAWFPWATELFNHSGWFWMWLMMKISQLATALPGAFFFVPSPALADFAIYYSVLIAVLSGFALVSKRRVWLAVSLVCLGGFYFWRWHDARGTTVLTILPLNGGSAVYCDAPGRRNDLLVDCGNASAVEFVMKPFLRAQGVNRLACLALTHGDLRRVGGVELVQTLVPIEKIAITTARFRSPAYRRIVEDLEETPEHLRTVNPGDALGGWTVLHPHATNHFPHADDSALVLANYGVRLDARPHPGPLPRGEGEKLPALEHPRQPGTVVSQTIAVPSPGGEGKGDGGRFSPLNNFGSRREGTQGVRVLLLSDLGRPGQNALLDRVLDLRAEIVVAGLPEQSEPLCDALLDAIQPRLIIISDSEFPATKRANATLRERLARRGVPVIYTRKAGSVQISLRQNYWEARAMDGTAIRR